jgi:hypothetical protein
MLKRTFRTIILQFFSRQEPWPLSLREEYKFDNKVFREIFGPKKDEVSKQAIFPCASKAYWGSGGVVPLII